MAQIETLHHFLTKRCTVWQLAVRTKMRGTEISQVLIKGSCLTLSLSAFKHMLWVFTALAYLKLHSPH